MPGEKRNGFVSRTIYLLFWISWIILTICLIASCSVQKPLLSQSVIPEKYRFPVSQYADEIDLTQPKIILLNDDVRLNNKIVNYWRKGWLNPIFKLNHPVSKLEYQDYGMVRNGINKVFDLYYVDFSATGLSEEQAKKVLKTLSDCNPLRTIEISFMMNSGSEDAFPRKPLSMLLISAHELLLQKGATPVYPQVESAYLRKRFGMKKLKSLEETILFATENSNVVYSDVQQGMVFCRRAL